MLLDRTIAQLDVGYVPEEVAGAMGHLGYMQWLGGLPGRVGYTEAACEACLRAGPFREASPAVEVFCHLIEESVGRPLQPLTLKLPPRTRRGGARARRGVE